MEDETSTSLDGKVLGNLRVVDLKQELEKRGLSKSGSKKDLVKRLKQQLEFEKLCEERKSSGDFDRKLELDAAIEQNEFVQQYLAQQQKRYAERKEQKRLQLEAQQKQVEGTDADSSENQMNADKSSDSDEVVDEKGSQNDELPKNAEKIENKDDANVQDTEMHNIDGRCSNTSETEDEEQNSPLSPIISESVSIEQKSPEPSDTREEEKGQCNSQSLVDVIENEEIIESKSPHSSESEGENLKTPKDSDIASENRANEYEDISVSSVPDSVKEQTDCIMHENINYSEDKNTEIISHDINDVKDNDKTATCAVSFTDIVEQTESIALQSSILDTSDDDKRKASPCHASFGDYASSENLHKPSFVANMESSECSSVPYSLSDIQLPESPGHHLKSKDQSGEESCNKSDIVPEVKVDPNSTSDTKIQSNGVSAVDTLNSSNEEVVSESETKESSNSIDSPIKASERKESEDNRQSDGSSDVESDKNDSQYKKKCLKYEDVSSSIAVDSEEENAPKDTPSKEQKSLKHPHQSDESDNDKSSDSDKYKHSRLDSKHKPRDKHRKRNRHSRSRSSSSSSSHSSDSSPKRRRSKKSVSVKNKNFENEEINQSFDKNLEEKPDKQKNEDSLIESLSVSSVSSKKRLKIKRDNAAIEVNISNVESVESISSKSLDNITSSDSHSVSENPSKQETTEIKLSFSELPYVPRKVSLSNRKFNRKSLEDKNIESKSKRSKWESFAAGQKVSQTISISSDSLKNWFPDFKLISETSTMELEPEPDEHSLSAVDEKNINLVHADVSDGSDIGMKRDSTSQMDIEDSESQEQNFEDSSNQGPVSKIIFIQNLVRPFTLNQLKDLLKQNGKIVDEYFWIDKIKSKCFVMYETEKEAVKARNALNNTRWPSSNPKILSVEFSNEEELEQHKKGNEPPPKPVVEPPVVETPEVIETRSHPAAEHKRKDRERRKERERSKPQLPVREWDKDKVMQDSPEREHIPKEEKSRSSDKKEKKESKKRPSEDTPAKLLDDLFQKTKNPPCIYWLPLTEEQAKQKEEAKKMRRLEREKRNQQLKEEEAERRNKRARSSRRSREKENRKSSTRSRSPVTRRR